MSQTSVPSQTACNDALVVTKGFRIKDLPAKPAYFEMHGQVAIHSAQAPEFGSTWNRWMDRIGAERGSKDDLLSL